MKIMTYEEFINSLIFRNTSIYIPALSLSIDKSKFVGNRGYNVEEQNIFLKDIYDSNLLIKK